MRFLRVWRALGFASTAVFVVGCSDSVPAFLPSQAELTMTYETGEEIYATPLGRHVNQKYTLLPMLKKRGNHLHYSKKRSDFTIPASGTVTLVCDYADCQFAGIIRVGDAKGRKGVVLTADKARTKFFFPPLADSYSIGGDCFASGRKLSEAEEALFEEFGIPGKE